MKLILILFKVNYVNNYIVVTNKLQRTSCKPYVELHNASTMYTVQFLLLKQNAWLISK
jgi:hypothetical protein